MPSFEVEFNYIYDAPGEGDDHSGISIFEFSNDETWYDVYNRYQLFLQTEVVRAYGMHPDYLEYAMGQFGGFTLSWVTLVCRWNPWDQFNGSFPQDVYKYTKTAGQCFAEILGDRFRNRFLDFWAHKPQQN